MSLEVSRSVAGLNFHLKVSVLLERWTLGGGGMNEFPSLQADGAHGTYINGLEELCSKWSKD